MTSQTGAWTAVGWVVLGILGIGVMLWLIPLAVFWAIGTLTGYSIPMNYKTAIAFWVIAQFRGARIYGPKDFKFEAKK